MHYSSGSGGRVSDIIGAVVGFIIFSFIAYVFIDDCRVKKEACFAKGECCDPDASDPDEDPAKAFPRGYKSTQNFNLRSGPAKPYKPKKLVNGEWVDIEPEPTAPAKPAPAGPPPAFPPGQDPSDSM